MLKANTAMLDRLDLYPPRQLCAIWEWTETQIGSVENVIIRDGIMQTIESKWPQLFTAWMENDYNKNPARDKLDYWFKRYGIISPA